MRMNQSRTVLKIGGHFFYVQLPPSLVVSLEASSATNVSVGVSSGTVRLFLFDRKDESSQGGEPETVLPIVSSFT